MAAMDAIRREAGAIVNELSRLSPRHVVCVTNRYSNARYALAVHRGQLELIAVMITPTSPSSSHSRAIAFHRIHPQLVGSHATVHQPQANRATRTRTARQPECRHHSDCAGGRVCIAFECQFECITDADCGHGRRCGVTAEMGPVCRSRQADASPDEQYPGIAGTRHLPEYVVRDALLSRWGLGFRQCANAILGPAHQLFHQDHHAIDTSWFIDGTTGRIEHVSVDAMRLGGQTVPAVMLDELQACFQLESENVRLPVTSRRRQLYRWSRGWWRAPPMHTGRRITSAPRSSPH